MFTDGRGILTDIRGMGMVIEANGDWGMAWKWGGTGVKWRGGLGVEWRGAGRERRDLSRMVGSRGGMRGGCVGGVE